MLTLTNQAPPAPPQHWNLIHQVYLLYIYAEVKAKCMTGIRSYASPVNFHAYANQGNNYNARVFMSYDV